MEDKTTIWKQQPPEQAGRKDAYLVHIYPVGPAMGSRYALGEQPLVLGRGDECQIKITDDSVSRRHSIVHHQGESCSVQDLQSTNGTYINNVRVSVGKLKDGDHLQLGGCIFRFLCGNAIEAEYHQEIHRLTLIDALTECYNKRYLLDFLASELAASTRYRRPMALVMFDIDHFKAINDQRGHLCGDFTLRQLAACARTGLRKADILARYGGEEFALVLPDTPMPDAIVIAERVRTFVLEERFEYEGKQFPVTVSLGVAGVTGEDWTTTTELVKQADDKLYQAKREGRNCVRS